MNMLSQIFLLVQNEMEQSLTQIGIAAFAAFMLFLIIDSIVKQKFIPKNGVTIFLIILFILSIIAFICYDIFLK